MKNILRKLSNYVRFWRTVEIVEVPSPFLSLDEEGRKAVKSLSSHPGFNYLMNKLRLQRHLLEGRLRVEDHADVRAVDRLQVGIRWLGWMETQVEKEVELVRQREKAQSISSADQQAMQEAISAYELVGT